MRRHSVRVGDGYLALPTGADRAAELGPREVLARASSGEARPHPPLSQQQQTKHAA